MRTKGLTYSDHIVPSVRNLISRTQTDAFLKKEDMGKEAVCRWRGSGNNPSGPHECRSPSPLGNVSSGLLSEVGMAAGWPLSASPVIFISEKCTCMTNCRQDAPRSWKAPTLCPLVFPPFLKTPSFHYALGTRKLIERYRTAGQPPDRPSPAPCEGLMPSRP